MGAPNSEPDHSSAPSSTGTSTVAPPSALTAPDSTAPTVAATTPVGPRPKVQRLKPFNVITAQHLERLHGSIAFVTPADRHEGRDVELLAQGRRIYEEARSHNPHRWTGDTRSWKRPEVVMLNPDRIVETRPTAAATVA